MPNSLALLSPLTPPSLSRAWLTAPHPTLPISATCSEDKTVRIYSLSSFVLLSTIAGGHKRSVRSVAWKPGVKGGAVLATGSFDASVGVWKREGQFGDELNFNSNNSEDENDDEEEEEWRFALVLDGHDSEVKSVSWSAGGNLLATCSRDKSVWIWEEVAEEDFETVAVLQEHGGDVKCVVWHPEEELLASGSYDDDVRLWREDGDDWGCIAVLKGHEATVWALDWEGVGATVDGDQEIDTEKREAWSKRRQAAGPRLASCSDDLTIRIWRRRPKERQQQSQFSIIRTGSNEEDWVEEARLPQMQERVIYSVAWSKKTGMIVSAGGDGRIVVYAERWKTEPDAASSVSDGDANATQVTTEEDSKQQHTTDTQDPKVIAKGEAQQNSGNDVAEVAATEWVVVAEFEGAHGVFEINHVCWAKRADKNKRREGEEIILSTGDDGVVKAWTLDVG